MPPPSSPSLQRGGALPGQLAQPPPHPTAEGRAPVPCGGSASPHFDRSLCSCWVCNFELPPPALQEARSDVAKITFS